MAIAQKSAWIGPEAYLLGENDRLNGPRYEYINGQVYAMVGASRAHNQIALSLSSLLHQRLAGTGCQVFQSDMKVRIQTATEERFYYPDIQVTCRRETETYFNSSPCLIVEVLSPNTERTDRTEKLEAYRLIESMEEYLLLFQESCRAEIYRRSSGWKPEHTTDNDILRLESLDLEVRMDEIYRGVF